MCSEQVTVADKKTHKVMSREKSSAHGHLLANTENQLEIPTGNAISFAASMNFTANLKHLFMTKDMEFKGIKLN
jgi:hypothetical protein